MKRHDSLSCFQYFYFKGLSRIKYIVLELLNPNVLGLACLSYLRYLGLADFQAQVFWLWHVFQTHATLALADFQARVL